jgi:hypothetical protein
MHILYITPSYYPHIGGVKYDVKLAVKNLLEIGHKITIIVERLGVG